MQAQAQSKAVPCEATSEEETWPSISKRLTACEALMKDQSESLNDLETKLRISASKQSTFVLFVVNGVATILVVFLYLISLESLLSMALSIGLTVYFYDLIQDNPEFNGSTMNWTLLSFAIVMPMSASIGMAFTRREKSLSYIATLRSLFFSIYQAHASWDWGTSLPTGRMQSKVDWLRHSDEVLQEILSCSHDLTRYLTLPSTSRARHRITTLGKRQAHLGRDVGDKLMNAVLARLNRISLLCEILKLEGLPGNEAARIRHWEREVVLQIELLQVIKEYRTPQAMRSLCRLFCVLLPAYYAPFYAQLAIDLNSLSLAIGFSILTSFALTALFEALTQMEDPFVANITLDGIDVPREVQQLTYKRLLSQRNTIFFSDANPEVEGLSSAETETDTNPHIRIFRND